MNNEELLQEINELIESEDGHAIEPEVLLIKSGLDSFGLTMVIISIDDKYELWSPKELEELDVTIITVQNIIDLVKEKHDC